MAVSERAAALPSWNHTSAEGDNQTQSGLCPGAPKGEGAHQHLVTGWRLARARVGLREIRGVDRKIQAEGIARWQSRGMHGVAESRQAIVEEAVKG